MMHACNHVNDRQLRDLLFEPEDSRQLSDIAVHVEACETCQIRLSELATDASLEVEASQLLSGYQSATRTPPGVTDAGTAEVEADSAYLGRVNLEPATHPEMLGRLGRYEIERCVGSGGMGVVFKAIDTELNRPVAIKVLSSHLARNGAARQRFSREARAAAAVVHEHVVAIHNVDSNADHPYLVMQYVAGESLQARIDREGPLDVKRVLRIGIQTALGLAAAHQQGIVHRDIKPANILLEDGVDRLLITDFGLARTVDDASLTHTGVVAGTPNYMSPEQASGAEVDHRTDLFSLGSVLYFVATGHPPFRAERAMGVLHRICHRRHRPVWQVNETITDELSAVIDRLLEKRPAKRYPTAAAAAEVLTRLLQQANQRQPGHLLRWRSWMRRHRAVVGIVASWLLVAVGLTAWSRWLGLSPWQVTRQHQPNAIVWPESSGNVRPEIYEDPAELADVGMQAESYGQSDSPDQTDSAGSVAGSLGIVAGQRAEFDRSLQAIETRLDELDRHAPAAMSDSSAAFKGELRQLEQALRAIDPSKQ